MQGKGLVVNRNALNFRHVFESSDQKRRQLTDGDHSRTARVIAPKLTIECCVGLQKEVLTFVSYAFFEVTK